MSLALVSPAGGEGRREASKAAEFGGLEGSVSGSREAAAAHGCRSRASHDGSRVASVASKCRAYLGTRPNVWLGVAIGVSAHPRRGVSDNRIRAGGIGEWEGARAGRCAGRSPTRAGRALLGCLHPLACDRDARPHGSASPLRRGHA